MLAKIYLLTSILQKKDFNKINNTYSLYENIQSKLLFSLLSCKHATLTLTKIISLIHLLKPGMSRKKRLTNDYRYSFIQLSSILD